ncbi:MAG: nucleotidyltransferase domain-containing protein [Candidatus Hodarchaeota archaeon]
MTDAAELQAICRKHIIEFIKEENQEPTVPDIVKRILMEDASLKKSAKELVATIKQQIAEINANPPSEMIEAVTVPTTSTEFKESEEYHELLVILKKELAKIEKNIECLIAFGSFAKGVHIPGVSDVNLLLILKEEVSEDLEMIEGLVEGLKANPLFSHLLDLVVLVGTDLSRLPAIYSLAITKGTPILKKNPFENLEITDTEVKQSAHQIIEDVEKELIQVLKEVQDEELAVTIIADLVISIVLALCYIEGTGIKKNLKKPEANEYFNELFKDTSLSKFAEVGEQAHAWRLGIKRTEFQEFIQSSKAFIGEAKTYFQS